jgi:hypothetical protein
MQTVGNLRCQFSIVRESGTLKTRVEQDFCDSLFHDVVGEFAGHFGGRREDGGVLAFEGYTPDEFVEFRSLAGWRRRLVHLTLERGLLEGEYAWHLLAHISDECDFAAQFSDLTEFSSVFSHYIHEALWWPDSRVDSR